MLHPGFVLLSRETGDEFLFVKPNAGKHRLNQVSLGFIATPIFAWSSPRRLVTCHLLPTAPAAGGCLANPRRARCVPTTPVTSTTVAALAPGLSPSSRPVSRDSSPCRYASRADRLDVSSSKNPAY